MLEMGRLLRQWSSEGRSLMRESEARRMWWEACEIGLSRPRMERALCSRSRHVERRFLWTSLETEAGVLPSFSIVSGSKGENRSSMSMSWTTSSLDSKGGKRMQKPWHIENTLRERVQEWEPWHGSYYELSMAYRWLSHQERLGLLQCAWSDVNLLGVVESPEQFGHPWHDPATVDPADASHCYGYIRLVDGHLTGCGSYFTSWENATWFSLYIPLGQLDQIFPVHYPLGDEDEQWISIVDASLAAVGAQIYCQMAFQV